MPAPASHPRRGAAPVAVRVAGTALRVVTLLLAAAGSAGVWAYGQVLQLGYFTTISVLVLLVVTGWQLVATATARVRPPRSAAGAAVAFTALAGLVAALLLEAEPAGAYVAGLTYDQIVHVVLPLLALADFVLLQPHGRLRPADVLRWLAVVLGYLVVVLVAGAGLGLGYPYPFLDPATNGAGAVAASVAGTLAGFVAICAAVVGLDRVLPARTPPPAAVTQDPAHRPESAPDLVGQCQPSPDTDR